jgi:hypothetical protein
VETFFAGVRTLGLSLWPKHSWETRLSKQEEEEEEEETFLV